MLDPVTLFKEGGPFMYLLLLVSMPLPMVVLLAAALGSARLRVPAVVWIGAGTLPLLVGVLGALQAFGLVLRVIPNASPEMASKLASNGFSVALYPLIVGGGLTAFTCGSLALAMGFGALVGVGGERRWRPLALSLLLGCALVLGILFLGRFMASVVTVLAFTGLAMSGLCDTEDEAHVERLAAARVATGTLGLLGVFGAAVSGASMVGARWGQVKANASAEFQARMMSEALDGAWLGLGFESLAMAGLLVGTLGFAALRAHELMSNRSLISAVLAGLPLLAIGAALGFTGLRGWSVWEETISPAEVRVSALADVVLPEVSLDRGRPMVKGQFLTLTRTGATLDDEPVTPTTFDPARHVTVEAAGDLPLGTLLPYAQKLVGGTADLAVRNRSRLEAIRLTPTNGVSNVDLDLARRIGERVPAEDTPRFEAVFTRGGWVLAGFDGEARTGFGTFPPEALDEQLTKRAGSDVRLLHVWLPEGAVVNDLVAVVAPQLQRAEQSRGRDGQFVVWRIDPPPSLPAPALAGSVEGGAAGITDVELLGSLDRTELNQVLGDARVAFGACLPAGEDAELKVVIGKTGRVSSVSLKDGVDGDDDANLCLVQNAKKLQLTPPSGGGVAIFSFRVVAPS